MATIQLNSSRLAVQDKSANIKVDGGYDFSAFKNDESVKYRNFKTIYEFNFYINSKKTSKKITETGKKVTGTTATLYGLSKGQENKVTVSISYSYEVSEYKLSIFGGGSWSDWEEETGPRTPTTAELKIYTRKQYDNNGNLINKADFWGNPSTGDYIDEHITVANTNDWLDQLGIWSSWKHQADHYSWTWYDSGISMRGVTVPNLNTSSTSDTVTIYTQSSGTDITGAWFRSCGNGCGLTVSTIKGLSDEGVAAENATHIKASHFTDLADKVTTWT